LGRSWRLRQPLKIIAVFKESSKEDVA